MGISAEDFIALYTGAQPALQRFVAAHVPDYHEVQDVLQEVAVCLWRKFSDYQPGTSFQRWAIKVAQNMSLHARRSHARRRVVLSPKLSEQVAEYYAAQEFSDVEARRRALDRCIEKLPPDYRDVVAARYAGQKRCDQIARESNCKDSLIRTRLTRIRILLRRCVKETLGLNVPAAEPVRVSHSRV